jgi:hypothetical protein
MRPLGLPLFEFFYVALFVVMVGMFVAAAVMSAIRDAP